MKISFSPFLFSFLLYVFGITCAHALEIRTNPFVARGATFAIGRVSIEGGTIKNFTEIGFCWSKDNPMPSIEDSHAAERTYLKEYSGDYGYLYIMRDLEPCSIYYVRAYGIRKSNGTVLYGDPVKIVTIPRGQVTWSYTSGEGSTEEVDEVLISSVATAVDYWNSATSITGFHVDVNYVDEIPTADCSYGGYIRVGANSGSHRVGTMLHEMNHGIGVGQHSLWYGYADYKSPYRGQSNTGDWLGQRTSALVKFLTNGAYEHLSGDKVHMWPFGINGAHEDTYEEILYLVQGLVTQALGEDGMPIKDKFHSPAYIFDFEEGEKYYLKPEAEEYGALTHVVTELEDGSLDAVMMTGVEAVLDDRAAWYLEFDLQTQYYRFRNATSGNYLSCAATEDRLYSSAEPMECILTESINKVVVGDYSSSTFWISEIADSQTPKSIMIHPWNGFALGNWSCRPNYSERQRWHIVRADDLALFDAVSDSGISELEIEANVRPLFPADVYDVSGRIVRRAATSLDGLSPGLYIVNGRKLFHD